MCKVLRTSKAAELRVKSSGRVRCFARVTVAFVPLAWQASLRAETERDFKDASLLVPFFFPFWATGEM